MIIKSLPVGPLYTNCFIIGCEDTKEAAVVDPGGDSDKILMSLADEKLTLKYIINTHGHFDHVAGNKKLKETTGAKILIHEEDATLLTTPSMGLSADNLQAADEFMKDGDKITFGNITLEVIHTPGHTLGGVSLYTDGHVFVGDTLFAGSIGRTDFPGGNYDTLINSVKDRLFPLGDEVMVYSGHTAETTIGNEKKYNPFFVGQ
ncbi:MAG: MBL fold metallo-hydrolase [Deltaproteobacteria bacterium]|nr:MBL fold metallo-hydrolase [Deltaproteobacteria bacterium]MBW1985006.1 MBL fold metallo-hydrolase [Deltaproteobacteria bacterium]MBW2181946.1 MBL fold metallo-hydrolase [Deltaproteobacteria bacterium]